jgi:riboflavin kinase/FMN adenylyltransferase
VVHGFQRGRTIGIPTANLDCGEQLIPAEGVYVGQSTIDGRPYPAAISIGTMPTFGTHQQQLEVHLIGFTGDLYGQVLRVEVKDWLREQWKFPSVAALTQRMQKDLAWVVRRAPMDVARPFVQSQTGDAANDRVMSV